MDFSQAGQQYQLLRQQLAAGAITQEQFFQQVTALRFQQPDGTWWAIDVTSGEWLRWDGRSWIGAGAGGVPQATAPAGRLRGRRAPAPELPAPESLWQFAALMAKNWVKGIPASVVSGLVIALGVWALHTWLVIGPNNGVNPNWAKAELFLRMIQMNSIQGSSDPRWRAFQSMPVWFWTTVSLFVTPSLTRLFTRPFAWFKGLVFFPIWTGRSVRSLKQRSLIPLVGGAVIAGIVGVLLRNYLLNWVLAGGFLLSMMAWDSSLSWAIIRLAIADLRRVFHVRLVSLEQEHDAAYLVLPGAILGFAVVGLMRTPAAWARWAFWGGLVVVAVISVLSVTGRRRKAAMVLLIVAMAFLCVSAASVSADDSGWSESGGTIRGLIHNAGWPMARKLGIKPALAAAIAGLLISDPAAAYQLMNRNGIDPRRLGLPHDAPRNPAEIKAMRDSVKQSIRDDMDRTQQEGVDALSWSSIAQGSWENWGDEARRLADLAGRASDAAWNGVKGAADVVSTVASDVWNNPGKYWDGAKRDAGALWVGIKETAANPRILVDTVTGTAGDVWKIGSNVVSNISSAIWTTVTDPGKALEFVKESVGWNNWNKILDPSVPIEERIANVLAGTFKLGTTLATLGQAKALLAGSKYAAEAAEVAAGTFTNTGVPKGASGLNQYLQRIQKIFGEFGVEGSVRPPNIARIPGGVPKPNWIKNKSLDFIDQQIGATGMEGGIGHFKPDEKAVRNLLDKIGSNSGLTQSAKDSMTSEVLARQAMRDAEFKTNEAYINRLVSTGKVEVKGGMIVDAGTGKPFTGDIDLFHLNNAATGAPISQQTEQQIIKELQRLGVPVTDTHGAHLNWVPKNDKEWKIYNDVIASHGAGGKPLVVIGADGKVSGAFFTPGGA